MLIPDCGCCGTGCDCIELQKTVSGLTGVPCRATVVHTETVTIPAVYSLPCVVKIGGAVNDDIRVNGADVVSGSDMPDPCRVVYQTIIPIYPNAPGKSCREPHVVFYCFLCNTRTFQIQLVNNLADIAAYDIKVCFGRDCPAPPPTGRCCEYGCEDCVISAQPGASVNSPECQLAGAAGRVKTSSQELYDDIPSDAEVEWASGYPRLLGRSKYKVVRDTATYDWCGTYEGSAISGTAKKYRWSLVKLDCATNRFPFLVAVNAFLGKAKGDGSRMPIESSPFWTTDVGDGYPPASILDFLSYRIAPKVTCTPICDWPVLEKDCKSKKGGYPHWDRVSFNNCATGGCPVFTTLSNPLP
jgi:hypothetical protein